MACLQIFRLKTIWGNTHFDYTVSLSRGASGGITSLWDPSMFVKEDIWCDVHFVIVKGYWVHEDIETYMVKVYAPQALHDKINLWNKIDDFMVANNGNYIIFGDWNAVRNVNERQGTKFCNLDTLKFNDFIESSSLYEVPLGGLEFTWRNKSGTNLSKLDRFFITNNILNVVCDLKGEVLPRGHSDHSSIMLFEDKVDFGPTHYKVFASLFDRPDFKATVRKIWSDNCLNSAQDFLAKLRTLKAHLKTWICTARSTEASRLHELNVLISDLDVTIDAGLATETQVSSRNEFFQEKLEIEKLAALDSMQKARIKWDVQGARTRAFFIAR
ncbi:uncharacterized protein [Rutidosis leptorrhynchoides]|uniref:uncharacterized protein n=1 Tax=Rutidosis leptorrhynchoides TaxID=125765 RepID=UPI003A9A4D1E